MQQNSTRLLSASRMTVPALSPRLRSTALVLPPGASTSTTVDVRVAPNRRVVGDDGGDVVHCQGQLAHNDTRTGVTGTQIRATARHHHGSWPACKVGG